MQTVTCLSASVALIYVVRSENTKYLAAYDVTRRETFESIQDIWMKEVDMYSTVEGAVKAIIANKVDQVRYSAADTISVCARYNLCIPLLGGKTMEPWLRVCFADCRPLRGRSPRRRGSPWQGSMAAFLWRPAPRPMWPSTRPLRNWCSRFLIRRSCCPARMWAASRLARAAAAASHRTAVREGPC